MRLLFHVKNKNGVLINWKDIQWLINRVKVLGPAEGLEEQQWCAELDATRYCDRGAWALFDCGSRYHWD